MTYWMELLHLPPSQNEMIVFAISAVFFTRFKEHLKLQQSALAALVVFLVIIAALPHLSDKGMFSFQDFGETLFLTPLGLILSRYAAFFLAISALRQVNKRVLPKKLFFKN
ncbi:MAG: hypothetical protein ACON4W_06895 [Parvibaculales bacterium]